MTDTTRLGLLHLALCNVPALFIGTMVPGMPAAKRRFDQA